MASMSHQPSPSIILENSEYRDETDDEDSIANDSSSVDTNEAFMEMLGLSLGENEHLLMKNDNDDRQMSMNSFEEEEIVVKESNMQSRSMNHQSSDQSKSYKTIQLPARCSRHLIPPQSCLALVIDNVLSKDQCKYLIERASKSNSKSSEGSSEGRDIDGGFRYITEAAHKAEDGTSYTVQIQNPNPHKLAVIDTFHHPSSYYYSSKDKCHKRRKRIYYGHEDEKATTFMDHIYQTISNVLNETSNPLYQKFVQRTNCGSHFGLNPRMRILKYDAVCNDRFEPHFDATTFVSNGSEVVDDDHKAYDDNMIEEQFDATTINSLTGRLQSLITVLVYLNDGDGREFDGGETVYLDYRNSSTKQVSTPSKVDMSYGNNLVKVIPKVGRVVLFEHDLYHSGSLLTSGTKYIMRTDVLYEEQDNNDGASSNYTDSIVGKTMKTNDTEDEILLLNDLCNDINLSSKDRQILEDMGLLYTTLEAFISPGITLLKNMLIDAGMNLEVVTDLIQRVAKSISS